MTWTAPVSDGGRPLQAYRATAFTLSNSKICFVNAPATTCTIKNLANGVPVEVRVDARNALGWGPLSPRTRPVTIGTTPGPPTGVTDKPGNRQVTVTWTAPASISGLPVTDFAGYALAPGIAKTCRVAAPATTCTITGLTNGLPVVVWVHARNALGWGAYSERTRRVTPATRREGYARPSGASGTPVSRL